MNRVFNVEPCFSRLLKIPNTNHLYNTNRTFNWQKYTNYRVKSPLLNVNKPYEGVPKRHLGWLLANKLRPGQRGYERQQKMYRRCNFVAIPLSLLFAFYMYVEGHFTEVFGLDSLLDDGSIFWNKRERNEMEELKESKRLRDEELLRLADKRKQNIEYLESRADQKSFTKS